MIKDHLFSFLIIIAVIGAAGCDKNEDVRKVDLSRTEEVTVVEQKPKDNPIFMAVGGMITPREGFAFYKQFLDYIGEKLGRRIEYVDREDYAEINKLMKDENVDAAFVCGGPYVDGHAEFGMELLVAPVAYGGTVYYSYIIVPKDSAVKSFEELRAKTFAFTDPLSNSGKLAPTYMLARMNETPDAFFSSYAYTHAHDKSIKAVATGIVDGAAVDSLIWEYENRTNPEYTSRTKIIRKSPPYGIPPVVVRQGLDSKTKESLRQIFLNAHTDEKGRSILRGMMIEKFVTISNSEYDSIREMKQWLEKKKGK